MRTYLMCLVILAIGVAPATAQGNKRANASLLLGIPHGDFADNVDNLGYGIDGYIGIGLHPVFMVGVDLGFMIYGTERRSEAFSTTIPDVRVEVETTNSIVMGDIFFRIQPQQGTFQPYLDGIIGLKYLATRTAIREEGGFFSDDEDLVSSTNFDDWATSLGAGAGFDIRLTEMEGAEGNLTTIMLHIGVRYLRGSSADYLKKGSIQRSGNNVVYDVLRSRTDLIIPKLGATFIF